MYKYGIYDFGIDVLSFGLTFIIIDRFLLCMHDIIELPDLIRHMTSDTPCLLNRILEPGTTGINIRWNQMGMNWGWKSREGFINRFFVDMDQNIIYEIHYDRKVIQQHKGNARGMFYDAVKLSEFGDYLINASPDQVAEEFQRNDYRLLT